MSRYKDNSFAKANKILNNLSDGITHADPDLNKTLMNARYNIEALIIGNLLGIILVTITLYFLYYRR